MDCKLWRDEVITQCLQLTLMSLWQIAFCGERGFSEASVCLFYVLNNFYVAFQRHCCEILLPDLALFPVSIFHRLQERHNVRSLVRWNRGYRLHFCPPGFHAWHLVQFLPWWSSIWWLWEWMSVCAHACVQDRCSTWLVRSRLIRYVCIHAWVRSAVRVVVSPCCPFVWEDSLLLRHVHILKLVYLVVLLLFFFLGYVCERVV